MSATFWSRVRVAFEIVAETPTDERAAVLEAVTNGDPTVSEAVRLLLAADGGDFLSAPARIPADVAEQLGRIPPGTTIGGYRVVHQVGRGGMGEVYEGRRVVGDFEKRVAIKVLRAGTVRPAAVARFERERRILARLDHPNIAALLDGGVLPDGVPFVIMEFVEGDRITSWCDQHALSLPERLGLFRQVCAAVSYAHRNLIVHRDLKPGNIFVTTDRTVKLLDFGIAKVLVDDSVGSDGETETRPEAKALTREYAAPEHLTDGPITTGTDVYALGLLLFELLAGRRPFAGQDLPFVDFVRMVTSSDPPPPSSIPADGSRGLRTPRERAAVRGDLDAIVLHALRASPTERYGTVDALVDDLRRLETGRPVAAVRGQRTYRMRKFIRRNRGAIVAAGLIGVSLLGGVIATLAQARRATTQRALAEATSSFLTEMLQSVNPAAQGRDVLMAEVLDSAARRISLEPPPEPEIEASLQSAIGASYTALGKFAAAEPHLRRALQLRERHPEDHLALSNAVGEMANLEDERGDFIRADTLYRRALAILPASRDTAIARRAANLLDQIARMESQQGHYDSAVALMHRAVAQRTALYGPSSAEVGRTMSDLGLTLLQKGDLMPAESVETRAVEILRHTSPVNRGSLGNAIGRLATNLELNGKRNAADSAYRESIELMSAALGPDHPDVTWIRYNYAGALLAWNHPDAAVQVADQVLALRGGTLPDTHPMVAGALITRGQALGKLGRHAEAERSIREGLALRERYLPPSHWLIGSVESILGDELWAGGKRDEGMRLMREGCRNVRAALGSSSPRTSDARTRLARAGDSTSCG